jgi:hypothetical protein
MNSFWSFSVALAVLVGLFVAVLFTLPAVGEEPAKSGQAQASSKPLPAGPQISWTSKELRALVENIDENNRAKLRPRDVPAASGNDVCDLLGKKYSKAEMHELAASFASASPKPTEWANYQYLIREALTHIFRSDGDHDGLVTLLAASCLRDEDDVEWLLAISKNIKDPILILGDAYAKAKRPETRAEIAAAVRRGFCGLGVTGRDDAELVKNAMEWFRQHRRDLELNINYDKNSSARLQSLLEPDRYEKNPLFVRRTMAKEKRHGDAMGASK